MKNKICNVSGSYSKVYRIVMVSKHPKSMIWGLWENLNNTSHLQYGTLTFTWCFTPKTLTGTYIWYRVQGKCLFGSLNSYCNMVLAFLYEHKRTPILLRMSAINIPVTFGQVFRIISKIETSCLVNKNLRSEHRL